MNSPPEVPPSDPDAKQRGDDGYLSVVHAADLTPTEVFPASKRPKPRSRVEPSLRGHQGLLVVCITGTLIESVLVGLLGPRAALALAPQATAIAHAGADHGQPWPWRHKRQRSRRTAFSTTHVGCSSTATLGSPLVLSRLHFF